MRWLTIKKMLKERGAFYIDRDLNWGAKLSDYRDILNDEQNFYGVELYRGYLSLLKISTRIDLPFMELSKISRLALLEQIARYL